MKNPDLSLIRQLFQYDATTGHITSYVIPTTVAYADTNGFVRFDGSQERIFIDKSHDFKVGDRVKITIEKENK